MNGEVDIDGKEYTAPFAYCTSDSDSEEGSEENNNDGSSNNNDGSNGSRYPKISWGAIMVAIAATAAVVLGMDVL